MLDGTILERKAFRGKQQFELREIPTFFFLEKIYDFSYRSAPTLCNVNNNTATDRNKQTKMLLPQMCCSVFSPLQSFPIPCGAGLVHVLFLVLVFFPCKQSVGQPEDHGPQASLPPSTARYINSILIPKFLLILNYHFQF